MSLLVRPYPTAQLEPARQALQAAQAGDFKPLQALFVTARDLLLDMDPDEVREATSSHRDAGERDKAALAAAADVADTWEGVVAVAATISKTSTFRGFILSCAAFRYLDIEDPELPDFRRWCRGEWLPDLGPEDSVLYAALPALIGLGPELADELPAPAPVEGETCWKALGLPDEDWTGVDPLDGMVISPDACADARPTAEGPWRTALARGARTGLLIRRE